MDMFFKACRFATEGTSGDILAFDHDFQKEVFKKYKKKYGLTNKIIQDIMDGDIEEDDYERPVLDDLCFLGVTIEDGKAYFEEKSGDASYDGGAIMDILEDLGYTCETSEDSNATDLIGVYFIV